MATTDATHQTPDFPAPCRVPPDSAPSPNPTDHVRVKVVDVWERILDALGMVIDGIDLTTPTPSEATAMTTAALKRYDDALEGLICGWIGIEYLEGRCTAFGDPPLPKPQTSVKAESFVRTP